MSPFKRVTAILILVMLSFQPALAAPSVVMQALKAELSRSMEALAEQPVPPYFLSYEVTEQDTVAVGASFGVLMSSGQQRQRFLDMDIRVGDYALDNTRVLRGPGARAFSQRSFSMVPIEDDVDAIRSAVWTETDTRYKQALEQLIKVRTNVQVAVAAEDQSEDFSRETPQKQQPIAVQLSVDVADWEDRMKLYSAPFALHSDIYDASASLTATKETRWFTNSEGAEIQTAETIYRLVIRAQTKAEDGMTLPRYESFSAFSLQGLPDDETVLKHVDQMIKDLAALLEAPVIEPYTGPAILSGRASGVFFHEILGHRIEGHRQKKEDEGHTFKEKLNEQILPSGFTVAFDPTNRKLAGEDLVGSYQYDNQGVRAQRINVVENGIFKNFLMSRTPIEGFPESNGHGRKQAGFMPVSRQSNLIVEVAQPLSREALKMMLLTIIREQGKPFGLLIEDIQGGFTTTGRFAPNAFNVQPLMAYRIHPDGREELVRGVDLIGTPLTTLSRVVAADDELAVFNGVCGAESGGVPVSAVSPAILISQIEIQKKAKSQERKPVLPPPVVKADLLTSQPGDEE